MRVMVMAVMEMRLHLQIRVRGRSLPVNPLDPFVLAIFQMLPIHILDGCLECLDHS